MLYPSTPSPSHSHKPNLDRVEESRRSETTIHACVILFKRKGEEEEEKLGTIYTIRFLVSRVRVRLKFPLCTLFFSHQLRFSLCDVNDY